MKKNNFFWRNIFQYLFGTWYNIMNILYPQYMMPIWNHFLSIHPCKIFHKKIWKKGTKVFSIFYSWSSNIKKYLSFTNRVSKVNVRKERYQKGIKLLIICKCMRWQLYVCLFDCPWEKWSSLSLIKFSGLVQLHANNFWAWVSDQWE